MIQITKTNLIFFKPVKLILKLSCKPYLQTILFQTPQCPSFFASSCALNLYKNLQSKSRDLEVPFSVTKTTFKAIRENLFWRRNFYECKSNEEC